MNILIKNNKLLTKKGYLILFFLIAFFIFNINTNAASFKFKDFDFDTFARDNLGHWTDICSEDTKNEENCKELVISRQKHYYTRLYKILAYYEKKYPNEKIDDNIIITTTFYGLSPDLFTDDGETYSLMFGGSAYNYLEEDYKEDKNFDMDFFEKEVDTLDLLIRNLFSYQNTCYAEYSDPTESTNEDGDITYICSSSNEQIFTINGKRKCAIKVSSKSVGFIDNLATTSNLLNNLLSFFKLTGSSQNECEAKQNEYKGANMVYVSEGSKKYNPEGYYEFLENSNYLDKKPHLKNNFAYVLNLAGKESMEDLSEEDYKKYDDEIKKARNFIISSIKEILEVHNSGKDVVATPTFTTMSSNSYWLPIGSDEVTEIDGKKFAMGDPVPYVITSHFGPRTKPKVGHHAGTDFITYAPAGETNIIAAKDGIVVEVYTGCISNGDTSCGGGYGNHVVISHSDGNYTWYAHMHDGTVTVSLNEPVRQGQVLGKIGDTGNSYGHHLHFEVRVGSIWWASAVNSLTYVDLENPRATSIGGDFYNMLICLEGKGADDGGDNYMVYDDNITRGGGGTLTVGPGVTLIFNRERFQRRGYNIDDYMKHGLYMPKDVVDDIKFEIIENMRNNILKNLSENSLSLPEHQVDALVIRVFNTGNFEGFVDNYKKYGNTQALYDNYLSKPTRAIGIDVPDLLVSRRLNEWNLFHEGKYFLCG